MSPARSRSVTAKDDMQMHEEEAVVCMERLDRLKEMANEPRKPNYLKLVVELLVELKKEIKEANARNDQLVEEMQKLREENLVLKQMLDRSKCSSISTNVPSQNNSHNDTAVIPAMNSPEDLERLRSVVIRGVVESPSPNSYDRVTHDFNCVNQLLSYLEVECLPVTVYRMGKRDTDKGRPRPLKVVLPCSRFQKDLLKRAPRLRFFSQKGIYINPSRTLEERKRIREERLRRLAATGGPPENVGNKLTSQEVS
ncbi:hypothetical protein Y032_0339g2970 [Ancylostoma ceylanicum]|uniref:Uncharacterized protein n=1 Tax=Ancylostoma ceylanicum TaxID=53326 RepID=A0A016RY40_9BILA|nr:hypothetical protein Y032_0339g2970 [Ancylostoma ceylanicum]